MRAGELLPAIAYARQHLAHWAETYEAEHQQACALLAFRCSLGAYLTSRGTLVHRMPERFGTTLLGLH